MCNCIEEIDQKLKEMTPDNNTKLDIPFTWGVGGISRIPRVRIMTTKRDEKNRKKPMSVTPSYCPFCGKPYENEVDA